jgi:hypothetical protein
LIKDAKGAVGSNAVRVYFDVIPALSRDLPGRAIACSTGKHAYAMIPAQGRDDAVGGLVTTRHAMSLMRDAP